MNGLTIARELRTRERMLMRLYRQLDREVTTGNLEDLTARLRQLQQRQLNLLADLIDELEAPLPPWSSIKLAQHVVQQGESIFLIAQKYNTTGANLLRVNPDISDPDDLRAGMTINLPIILPPLPASYFDYVVKPNDTLFQLAQRFNTTLDELIYYNSISNPDLIYPGRVLIIPYSDTQEERNRDYRRGREAIDDRVSNRELEYRSIERTSRGDYRGSIEEKLFAANTRFRLERILDNFTLDLPSAINFDDYLVVGAVEYDITEINLQQRRIKVVVRRKNAGYHLVQVAKEQFRAEGTYRIDFVTNDGQMLDRDRIDISN
ncbi:MAG: LysM peptidoglycan-binding domain-containing protein [Bacillota bacterium]